MNAAQLPIVVTACLQPSRATSPTIDKYGRFHAVHMHSPVDLPSVDLQYRTAPRCCAVSISADADGVASGVFLLNSNGMDILLQEEAITYR